MTGAAEGRVEGRHTLRAVGFAAARGSVWVALTGLILEGLFRVAYPAPPIQVIRPEVASMRVVRGVPIWDDPGSVPRQNATCRERWPDARRVVFVGSSITYGTDVPPSRAFPAVIQQLLNAELGEGRVCIENIAEPGYSFLNKLVTLEEHLAGSRADLVVWEVWHNDPHDFTLLGGSAYSLRNLPRAADGFPRGPLPDGSLHRWLFTHSRGYEYLTLITGAANRTGADDGAPTERVAQVLDLCRAHGAELVLMPAPGLDRPFAEQLDPNDSVLFEESVRWAEGADVKVVMLAGELREDDYLALRMDSCCHYNVAGHARVARALLASAALGPLLRPSTPVARDAEGP